MIKYTPPPPPGMLKRMIGWKRKTNSPIGVYLWGTVGTGKTMLMDLFFDCCPFKEKKRVSISLCLL